MIGGDALQAADRDRFCFYPATATRRLAWAIAYPTENARKYVRLAIDEIGLAKFSLRDEPNIFGNVGVGWTSPLAIDDTMKVIRISSIGRFHRSHRPCRINRHRCIDGVSKVTSDEA